MAKPVNLPTIEQIQQLPVDLTMTVPPQWEDRNGHVNVQHYLGIYHLGGWKILENIGISHAYLTDRKIGIFDLEHHIRYVTEIQTGEVVSVYSRVISRNDKLLHGMLFIINDTRQRVACSIDYLSICIDQQQRRSSTFPQDMAAKLDELLAEHDALNWQASTCDSFSI